MVEADRDSPGVAAAHAAAETGRVVCAVPGSVTATASRGTHALIASGTARLVAGTADVLAAVTDQTLVGGGRSATGLR